MVWPVDLAILYPFSKYPPSNTKILVAAFVLVLITGAVVWARQRYPFLVTGWLWYLATLLPVIGLIQIGQHSVADRYTYIPLTGLFVMIVWGLPSMVSTWRFSRFALGSAAALAAAGMITLTGHCIRIPSR